MARNGSGTYSLYSPGNPAVTGTVISSTTHNNTLNDIATALTQSIASTGVTTPTANLPMGTYRHTGVGNATAQACYASVTDVQNGSLVTLSSVSGADTITATAPLTVAAYAAGQRFQFVSAGANTGAVTLNVSSLGAKAITKLGATALAAGDIPNAALVEVVYDGTQFQIVGGLQLFKGAAAATVDLLTGANIASASTINLDTATGNRVHVTGTTTITAVTLTRGPRTVIFDGALTLTHHATNNYLPTGANITTAAGDVAIYESDGTTVRCVSYTRADGKPLALPTAATQSQMEAASSNAVPATPGTMNWHPGVAKAWIHCDASGNINASHNISSISDDGTGLVTVNFATDFSSASYAAVTGVGVGDHRISVSSQVAGSLVLNSRNSAGAADDPVSSYYLVCFGDQA
jgi:hypothetical protein